MTRTLTIEIPDGATMRDATRAFQRLYIERLLADGLTLSEARDVLAMSVGGFKDLRRRVGAPILGAGQPSHRWCADCGDRMALGRRADTCAACSDRVATAAARRWRGAA